MDAPKRVVRIRAGLCVANLFCGAWVPHYCDVLAVSLPWAGHT
jgi:hypothetical protein